MLNEQSSKGISFSIFDLRCMDGQLTPVMCVDGSDEQPQLELHLLRYAIYLKARGDRLQDIRAQCYALGLLRDFYLHAWEGDVAQPLGLTNLCAGFLRARRYGLSKPGGNGRPAINWPPVQSATVRRDRSTIAQYATFCVTEFSSFSILPLDQDASDACRSDLERLLILKAPLKRGSDLLAHLHKYRRLKSDLSVGIDRRHSHRRSALPRQFLSNDDARRVIDRTRSVMQKMLLIEAFYGGPRLSEMLHHWRCDVLPGSYRRHLFIDDVPSLMPLVVLAEPSDSTYTGCLHDDQMDRLQHLFKFYGRKPRTLLRGSPEGAGWKGLEFDNATRLTSQVFWVDPDYAQHYIDLYRSVQTDLYARIPPEVLNSHPYLYVNDDPSQPEFGMPLKASNARKIFARAIGRVESIGPEYKIGSHSARHTYKSILETLLPDSAEDRAKCLHHKSVVSQQDYAKESSAAHKRLYTALSAKELK